MGDLAHGQLREPALRDLQQHVAQLFAHLPRRRRMALGYFSGDVIFVSFMKRYPQPEPGSVAAALFLGRGHDQLAGLADTVGGRHHPGQRHPAVLGPGLCRVLALLGILLSMLGESAPAGCHGKWPARPPWPRLRCRSSSTSWWRSPRPSPPARLHGVGRARIAPRPDTPGTRRR